MCRYVRNQSVQKLDWLVVEEITQLDMGGPGVRGAELLGDFRQLPAALDSWAGQPISAPLEHSQLVLDLAGGHRHELTENMRSNPGRPGWPETTTRQPTGPAATGRQALSTGNGCGNCSGAREPPADRGRWEDLRASLWPSEVEPEQRWSPSTSGWTTGCG